MIDWVIATIPYSHIPIKAGSVMKITPEGDVDWESPCRLSVAGSYESNFTVRSTGGDGQGGAESLHISGNPSKFLQGHNVFGSDDLIQLVKDTMDKIFKFLKLNPPQEVLNLIQKGEYQISMIDINYSFQLPSLTDVHAWLAAAEFKSVSRHGRPLTKLGTVYWGKHSRRWALKAYSKHDEIDSKDKKHRLHTEFEYTPIKEWSRNILRIELRLLSKELKTLELTTAKLLTKQTIKKLFDTYTRKIDMNAQIKLTDEKFHELPQWLRTTYLLWKDGHRMRDAMAQNTFYRHKRALLKYGINIDISVETDKPDTSNVVPLVRVLEAKQVEIPQWAFDMNLIHKSASGF